MQLAWKLGLVALVALALTAMPAGSSALNLALTLLTMLFFAAMGMLGYRMYREHRFELDSLESRQRLVLYASVGVAFLTFTATNRLFDEGGVGVLAWLALLGACSYGVFWVWSQYRSYG
jgi:hypothetical protein